MYFMINFRKKQKRKAPYPKVVRLCCRNVKPRRSGCEDFCGAVIDDYDSHIGHAPQLLRCLLVEGAERFLNALTHGESTRERDFSPVSDLLPVQAGHQNIGEWATVNVIDAQEYDDRLLCSHAALRQPTLEVLDAIGVQFQCVLAVVLADHLNHGHSVGVIQHQLTVDLANNRSRIVIILLSFAHRPCSFLLEMCNRATIARLLSRHKCSILNPLRQAQTKITISGVSRFLTSRIKKFSFPQ